MSVTENLLRPLLRTGGPRPLITYYDDAGDTRVELSRLTMANWAAKTANWLVDEMDVMPADIVAVRLPAHWQTAGVLLGAWWCGARVTDDVDGASVALTTSTEASALEDADAVAAVGLDALGGPVSGLPPGVLDYSSEIRACPDDFMPRTPVSGDTPALMEHTVDDVVELAQRRARDLGLSADSRVLSTVPWDLREGVFDGLLAILAAHASLVHCAHADPELLPRRRETEKITVELSG